MLAAHAESQRDAIFIFHLCHDNAGTTTTGLWYSVDGLDHGGIATGALDSVNHARSFPGLIGRLVPMLQLTAATGTKMPAWRVNSVIADRFELDNFGAQATARGAVGASGDNLFSGQRLRHKDLISLFLPILLDSDLADPVSVRANAFDAHVKLMGASRAWLASHAVPFVA